MIDNKPFFNQPVKNKQKAFEKLIEMSKNDDYTTGNVLDYLYYQNSYELIDIDLSKPTNTTRTTTMLTFWWEGIVLLREIMELK